jgi:hypothetical protein
VTHVLKRQLEQIAPGRCEALAGGPHDDDAVERDDAGAVGRCGLTVLKPVSKAPKFQRMRLEYHKPLSTFAFILNLRRCTEVAAGAAALPEREAAAQRRWRRVLPAALRH